MERKDGKILVRATIDPCDRLSSFRWAEFHKVDLKEGSEIEHYVCPDLQIWSGAGKLLRAGRKIYIVGGLMEEKAFTRERAAIFDMDKKEGWKHVQIPTIGRTFVTDYAVLGSKIYHIAKRNRYPDAAAVAADPSYGGVEFWEFVWTDELTDRTLIGPLVPDPANSRILLRLDPGKQLYAYYPADRRFQLLANSVSPWTRVAAVANDVLYVHDPYHDEVPPPHKLLYAFDLSNGEALNVSWQSTVFEGVIIDGVSRSIDFHPFQFHALLHVENTNLFWLATYGKRRQPNRLYFIKFEVGRIFESIICKPIAIRTAVLESNTIPPYDFLLLQD